MRPGTRASGSTTQHRNTASASARCGSGRGLAGRPRDEYVLSTKVGRLLRADAPPNPDDFGPDGLPFDKGTPAVATVYDYSRDGVLTSIEESLARLGKDRLDLVYVHDPDNYVAKPWPVPSPP